MIAKPSHQKEWTEIDQLKAENRLLKAQLLRKEMEEAYAKKSDGNTQSGGKRFFKQQAIKELNKRIRLVNH